MAAGKNRFTSYFAFISYSHTDEAWAKWLHQKLETFRVPKRLQEEYGELDLPKQLFPVFRDREELPTSADLGANIRNALESSKLLIVICSPRSARSRWVEEEIVQFKVLHGASRVLCFIVDGEPHASNPEDECFSNALKYRVSPDGTITDEIVEPIAADARPGKDGRRNAFLKTVAGLLGVRFDSLKRRYEIRKRQRRIAVAAFAASILALFAVLGVQWKAQQQLATFNELQKSGNAAISRVVEGDYARGISELHGILSAGDKEQLSDYAAYFDAWIGRFSPLEHQIEQLPRPTVFRWRSREYFRGEASRSFLLPEGTPVVTGFETSSGFVYSVRESSAGKATAFQIDGGSGKMVKQITDIVLLDGCQLFEGPAEGIVLLTGNAQSSSAGSATFTVLELDFKKRRQTRYLDEELESFNQRSGELKNLTLSTEDLRFPEMLPEVDFWIADNQPDATPDAPPEWHSWLPNVDGDADLVQQLFESANWDGFETSHDNFFNFVPVPFQDKVTICAMGSQGVQYGVWTIFPVEKAGLRVTKGLSVEFHGDFGDHGLSPDRRCFYIQNLQYLGKPAFDLVDLENVKLVTPQKQPSGAGALAHRIAFSANSSRFAMIAEDGTLWTYEMEEGADRFRLANSRNLENAESILSFHFLTDEQLLIVRSNGTLQLIDPATKNQYWVTAVTELEMGEETEVIVNARDSQFCLFDGRRLQIHHGATGAPLTSILSINSLIGDATEGVLITPPAEDRYWRLLDATGNRQWKRSVSEGLQDGHSLETLTGFEQSREAHPLDVLPGSNP